MLNVRRFQSHFGLFMFLSIVGNKNDDPDNKVVLTEDAQQFADQMGIDLFETSAKENINVEEVGNMHFLNYLHW